MTRPVVIAAMFVAAAGACYLRFAPILWRMVDAGDFPGHVRFAQEMAATGRTTIPHFGYHLFVLAVHNIVPGAGWPAAAVAVSLAGIIATALILTWWIERSLPPSRAAGANAVRVALAAVLPLALLVAQPVLPLQPQDRDPWLVGYFPANQLHNPTTMFSKPVALALFGFGVRAAWGGARSLPRHVTAAAALVVLSGLVKPSFLMAFLPAVAIVAAVQRRRADWRLAAWGLTVPAAVLLAAQFVMRYRVQDDYGVSVVFAPLHVIRGYVSADAVTLAAMLAASIVFPVAVTASFPRAALRDRALVLGWIVFACGISYGYLLEEAGGKGSAGDFLWSGQLAAFALFAVAAMFLLRRLADRSTAGADVFARGGVCVLTLLWHVASGVRHLRASWFD